MVIALRLKEQIHVRLLNFIKLGGEDDATKELFAKSSRVQGAHVCMDRLREGQVAIGVLHTLEMFVQPFPDRNREGWGNSLQLESC